MQLCFVSIISRQGLQQPTTLAGSCRACCYTKLTPLLCTACAAIPCRLVAINVLIELVIGEALHCTLQLQRSRMCLALGSTAFRRRHGMHSVGTVNQATSQPTKGSTVMS
jgi:hypothetical protein